MEYWVYLNRRGKVFQFKDRILKSVYDFDLLLADLADELGLCKDCPFDCVCHVLRKINENTWDKLCSVLFHDLIKPPWKLEELT